VATSGTVVRYRPRVDEEGMWGSIVDELFFFHRVVMDPPALIEHMQGLGLMAFFDHSNVVVVKEDGTKEVIKDVRYVHARGEPMRGDYDLTSVLLAKTNPERTYTDAWWYSKLPEIYMSFQSALK